MFLSSIANYYIDKFASDMSQLTFVFPSQRAGVFFKNELQKIATNKHLVLLAPHITTISELLSDKTGLNSADNITLTFKLYKVYTDVFRDVESVNCDFSFFYSWASTFLGDFDDIDKYLVDAEQVFTNTYEYSKIHDNYEHLSDEQCEAIQTFWNVCIKPDTNNEDDKEEYKRRFLDVFSRMFDLYKLFREELSKDHLAYDGMIYREASERIKEIFLDSDDNHYIFVGFNALTKAEINIFNVLKDAKRADFFWDYTPEMVESYNKKLEKGCERFILKHANMFPAPESFKPLYPKEFPEIKLTNFAYPQGQTAAVTSFVKKHLIDNYDENESTAIILTDENMLLPVLSAIPDLHNGNNGINVTMGYPIKFSQIYGLVDLLHRLQTQGYFKDNHVYARIVQPILQHPCITDICNDTASKLINEIIKNNIIYVPIKKFEDSFLSSIFTPIDSTNVADYIITIFKQLFEFYSNDKENKNNAILQECVYSVIKTANRFKDILVAQKDTYITDTHIIFNMFNNILSNQSIDFCGMPLSGLQVMGILETRAVNFDKLIILDMNEGIFPKKSTSITLIPRILRQHFELPTHEHQDAIFAYYFFRLIRRAKLVELLYTTSNENENRKGLSRFVLQLKYQHLLDIPTQIAIHQLNIRNTQPRIIQKNDTILKQIKDLYCGEWKDNCKFISPSALSVYLECPIKFYYSKIMKIDESNDIVEDAGNNDIGTIFHYVMEKLYTGKCDMSTNGIDLSKVSLKNGVFDEDARKKLLSNKDIIEQLICRGFETTLKLTNVSKDSLIGRNRLYYNIILKCIEKLILSEEPFTLINAEEMIKGSTTINVNDECYNVRLGGIIDRQHIKDGKYFVIDYKTGKKMYTKISNIDCLFDKNNIKYKAIFQTLLYCKLLSDNKPDLDPYPGVIWIQALYSNKLDYTLNINNNELSYNNIKTEFNELLNNLLSELFDKNISFTAGNKCNNCQYTELCYQTIIKEE